MIDTHAHLNYAPLDADIPGVLDRAAAAGVTRVVVPGTNLATSTTTVEMSAQYPAVVAAVGFHPEHAEEWSADALDKLRELILSAARGPRAVASIGEVGLDWHHLQGVEGEANQRARVQQETVFRAMLALASEFQLPVILHSWDAGDAAAAILSEVAPGCPTVVHCFDRGYEEAVSWIDRGCLISFTGMLTYKKNADLREVAAKLPLDRMMAETDAPFLPPEGFRGQVNEPRHVAAVVRCLAALHGVSEERVDQVTTATATRFFGL